VCDHEHPGTGELLQRGGVCRTELQVPVTVGLVKVAWNSLTTTAARDTILISAAPAPSPMVTIAVTCLVFFVLTDGALRPRQSSTQLVVRV